MWLSPAGKTDDFTKPKLLFAFPSVQPVPWEMDDCCAFIFVRLKEAIDLDSNPGAIRFRSEPSELAHRIIVRRPPFHSLAKGCQGTGFFNRMGLGSPKLLVWKGLCMQEIVR